MVGMRAAVCHAMCTGISWVSNVSPMRQPMHALHAPLSMLARVQVLRMVSGLLSRFPGSSAQDVRHELAAECTDTTIVNMLCLMTRGVSECQQLVDVTSTAYSKGRA